MILTRHLLITTLLLCGGSARLLSDDEPVAGPVPATEVVWQVDRTPDSMKTGVELLNEGGQQIHRFQFSNTGGHQKILLTSNRPVSRLHDEFMGSVRLHSTVGGVQVALRVVLPQHRDPRTKQPLVTYLPGEICRKADSWHVIRVAGTTGALESQLRRVRAELHRSDVDTRNAYVTGLTLLLEVGPGETFVDIGLSDYGPVVFDAGLPITKVAQEEELAEPEAASESKPVYLPLKVELNHVLVNEQPVVLRFAPDHGESLTTLRQMGLNAVWISDCRDAKRADLLSTSGIAVLATPPQPTFEPGNYTAVLQASPPLDQLCPNVSAWLLGTRVSPDQLPRFLAISRETRSADRVFRRPQMADVTSAEGAASREIELVGIGKHVVGREDTFGQLRNQTFRRQRGAGQMSFPWMWIQTEPSSQQQTWRMRMNSSFPHVEPEQILAQAYAATSAGCKGIGFWKTRELKTDSELDQETLAAIELANLELSLLEPFLAKGRVDGHHRMQPANASPAGPGPLFGRSKQSQPWIQSALNSSVLSTSAVVQEEPDGPDATIVSNGGSMLIMANHWDKVSQYVPAPMFSPEISMIVPASETASAWQLSATGIRALRQEITAGGLKMRIENFDRHAAILITSDPNLIRSLEQRIYQVAERSTQLTLQLATLKHLRVLATTEKLREYGAVPTDVSKHFTSVRRSLDRAQHESTQRDFHEASQFAREALRILRQIQTLCWKEAMGNMISPSAAPHTVSFATLPDHWAMVRELQQRKDRETPNQLPAGSFENQRLLSESGWQSAEAVSSGYLCKADVLIEPASGNSALLLAAWIPNSLQKAVGPRDSTTPLVFTTPPVAVEEGDIVRITGRMRRGRSVPPQSKRPLLLFDSEMGPECGVQLTAEHEWTKFEMLRQIAPKSTTFRFSMALTSVAEVHIDDLSITRFPADLPANRQSPGPVSNPLRLTGEIRDENSGRKGP